MTRGLSGDRAEDGVLRCCVDPATSRLPAGPRQVDQLEGCRSAFDGCGHASANSPLSDAHAGTPGDGVIARRQFAGVLVASTTSANALRKTFELVATQGPTPDDLEPLFAALEADAPGALDAVRDLANMPLQDEPGQVQEHLAAVQT